MTAHFQQQHDDWWPSNVASVRHGSAGNVRDVWRLLDDWGSNEDGRGSIKKALRLCPAAKLTNIDAVNDLKEWLQAAFDSLVGF